MSVVLGASLAGVDLDDEERRALRVFAAAGLLPDLLYAPMAGDIWPVDADDLPCGYLPVHPVAPVTPVDRPVRQPRIRRSAA